jgi:hypothetical protein
MTARQIVLSFAIVFHVAAITLAAIPRPTTRTLTIPTRTDDAVASALGPPLTVLARALNAFQETLHDVTGGVQRVTNRYLAAGLRQNWSMFSNVLSVQRYVRIDYYVRSSDGGLLVTQQLVLPSQSEDAPRLTYRTVDKAVRGSMDGFLSRVRAIPRGASRADEAQSAATAIAPLVRHFRQRLARDRGLRPEDIVRLEVWAGAAEIPPPDAFASSDLAARRAVLAPYRNPTPRPIAPPYPAVSTVDREADITWQLVYLAGQP